MIYVKWLLLTLIDYFLLIVTAIPAAIIVPLFTRAQSYDKEVYTWGWLWGTYDNPPQGDEGYVAKRAWFIGETTGWKGYLNRVGWMLRNPLYGYSKLCGLKYDAMDTTVLLGNENISDKYKIPGWMFARLYRDGKLVGFEFYCVKPWSETKDLRARLGWKMTTDKFASNGFAQLVNTINPFDGYGDD